MFQYGSGYLEGCLGEKCGYITNQPFLLSSLYAKVGLAQNIINSPIQDAFKKDIEITFDEESLFDEEDKKKIDRMTRYFIESKLKPLMIYGALYGGSAMLLLNESIPSSRPLRTDKVIKFLPVDRWQLSYTPDPKSYINFLDLFYEQLSMASKKNYHFYFLGQKIHLSRVIPYTPSNFTDYISRAKVQNWGWSELEKVYDAIENYLICQKAYKSMTRLQGTPVGKYKGFVDDIVSRDNTAAKQELINSLNREINQDQAVLMDVEDDIASFNVNMAGIGEVDRATQDRISAESGIPSQRVFGRQEAGLGNNGESEINKNYFDTVKSTKQTPAIPLLENFINIIVKQSFPEVKALETVRSNVQFLPLETSDPKEEEEILRSKQARILELEGLGITTRDDTLESLKKEDLIDISVKNNQSEIQ